MNTFFGAWWRIPFWQRVVAGFVLGALAGWAFGPDADAWFGPLGDVYVNLIRMIAIPLVFFAVIHAVASLHGQKSIAALGGRTFLWFAATAVFAVCIGLLVGETLRPGEGVGVLRVAADYRPREVPDALSVLTNIVPANPLQALAGIVPGSTADGSNVMVPGHGTVLQVIFFAALVGFALVRLGERTARLRGLAGEASEVMIQVTRFVLQFTPLGTFGLIASLVGTYGFAQLQPLLHFVAALVLACAVQVLVVYSGLLLSHGLNPMTFFFGAGRAMQVALVTSSSFAAMPAALRAVIDRHGVDRDYAAFAVPLGASIKMDGCGAIYPALAAVFIAQYTGIELAWPQYLAIMLASVLGSFGTAGVPGTAVVMATVVLSAAGLPLEAIGYLYAIDRVLDMVRTATNVTGQMLVPVLVAKETGLLERAAWADGTQAPGSSKTMAGLGEG